MADSILPQEQLDEIEALQSIFMEDFVLLKNYPAEMFIKIRLNHDECVLLTLSISFPLAYPEVVPEIVVRAESLNQKCRFEISKIVKKVTEENISIPMIFTLIEEIKDYLGTNEQEATNEDNPKNSEKKDQKQTSFTNGTIITPETFEVWKNSYLQKTKNNKSDILNKPKKTGKQIFLENQFNDKNFLTKQEELVNIKDQNGNTFIVDPELYGDDEIEIDDDNDDDAKL